MDAPAFKKFNPNFEEELLSKGEYMLWLPKDKMKKFNSEKYSILQESINYILSSQDIDPVKTLKPEVGSKKKAN